jgi:two-component system OmpR family response regulator
MRILLVEDDIETSDLIGASLRGAGHQVDNAFTGPEGLDKVTREQYDVAIVDRHLPHLDGLQLVKMLRTARIQTRVIFLTSLSDIDDRIDGLNAGADDYLVKPFDMSELLARVGALSRRSSSNEPDHILRVGDLEMNLIQRTVTRAGRALDLQQMEFKLLETLVRHAGQVVTRTMLLQLVWKFRFDPKTSIVETHISRLRAKIDRGFPTKLIETVPGSGYRVHG